MLRKRVLLSAALVTALSTSPMAVMALGFGGIKLKSALNEPLNAEIDLISPTEEDINSLKVKIASDEAFLRTGIERTALHSTFQYAVKKRSNGDYYISVTTKNSVREPFLNFLLEMDWKNGRMLREYTMLLDPPGRVAKKVEPAPVVAETVTAEPAPEPAPEPMPEQAPMAAVTEPMPEPVPAPAPEMAEAPAVASGGTLPEPEAAEPMPEPVPAEPMPEPMAAEPMPEPVPAEPMAEPIPEPMPVEEPSAVAAGGDEQQPFAEEELFPRIPITAYGEDGQARSAEEAEPEQVASGGMIGEYDYGITKKNDNLWTIAEKLRGNDQSVTVYQMMMALLKSNPDAFVDNNVHRLKVGHVLRIDDPSLLGAMSSEEAAKAYGEQTEAWNSYRQAAAESAGVQPIMAGEDVQSEVASRETSGELTLASPDGETAAAGGGTSEEAVSNDLATLQEQLRQAKSDAGTMRSRNQALNNKLQDLEDELNRLQRSITVKDDELAALQKQLAELNQKPVVVAKPTVAEEAEEAAPSKPEVKPAPVAEEPEEQSAAAPETKPEEKSPVEIAAEIEQAEKTAAGGEIKETAPEPAKPNKPQAQPSPATTEEPGFMDMVMGWLGAAGAFVVDLTSGLGGDMGLYIGGGLAVVVLLLLIMIIRRRKSANFQESILTGVASSPSGVSGPTSGDSTSFSEESSFLSDFAMSGASAIQADDSEVDPLTEADVFMAYGRYEAAEERLNEAIQNEPDRMELRAKLLELFHTTQNKSAFETAAEDFYASLNGATDHPLWQKVLEMGAEIAPENPLFADSAAGGMGMGSATTEVTAADPGMDLTDSQVMDIGLETGVFQAEDLSGGGANSDFADLDFNLDLNAGSSSEPAADLDFNMDMGETATPAASDSMGMDFNLDMGETTAPAESSSMDMDFNLDMGETAAPESSSMDMDFNLDMGETAAPAESSSMDMDFNLDMGESTAPESSSMDMDFNLDMGESAAPAMDLNLDASDAADMDFGGGDEVGTKLDLAKAYIDMGDPEGARSILDEVLDEGNDVQKQEAQQLLQQIA